MKIGLAQINTTVGDLAGNQRLIASAYKQLLTAGAELVVFPELSLCGYPLMIFIRRFVAAGRELAQQWDQFLTHWFC